MKQVSRRYSPRLLGCAIDGFSALNSTSLSGYLDRMPWRPWTLPNGYRG